MNRVYHPYWLWEEYHYNMWGRVRDRESYLQKAIEFTGDHIRYGGWMRGVARDWQYSCEHNLSGSWQNRRAWIGHAACAYAFKCPEDIVRQAWGYLTESQQVAANAVADEAIEWWECQNGN